MFALLRTANACGVILAGLALTALSLTTALATVTGLMLAAALAVGAERRLGGPATDA